MTLSKLLSPVLLVGLIAFAVRLTIVVNVPNAFPWDMGGWIETTQRLVVNGVPNIYAEHLQGNLYPPGFFYPLWFVGQTYRLCCSPQFDPQSPTIEFLLRLSSILADSFIAMTVYLIARMWLDARRAFASGVVYVFNPVVLTTTAWMSMIGDPYYLLLVMLALYAALNEHWLWASALIVLAVMIKPQAMAFAPLVGFLIVTRANWRQMIASGVTACVVGVGVWLPFILGGTLEQAAQITTRMRLAYPFLHVFADNFWFLIAGGREPWDPTAPNVKLPDALIPYDTNLFLGVIAYREVGLIAFGVLCLIVLYGLLGRTKPHTVVAAGAAMAFGFFMLSTRMHVNYAFPVFAFLAILVASREWWYTPIGALTIVTSLVDWELFDEFIPARALLKTIHLVNAGFFVLAFVLLLLAVRATIAREPRVGAWRVPIRTLVAVVLIASIGAAGVVWLIWIRE
ncbi:MAG: DUF2029 domain-containing protein [Chloroflexi bacterium]|nr:DUF2029 domain-containing protein [Chloroflexota bacterium]